MSVELFAVIVPCITSLLASFVGIYINSKVIEVRIKELEKKVDKHNNLIERMVLVEASSKSAHKRLDDIERCNRK